MIETKYQAVEYFTFLQKICSRSGCRECVGRSCGVVFIGNHAYSANTNLLGRVKVHDDLFVYDPIFWAYGRDGEINRLSRDKFLLNVKGYVEQNPDMEPLFKDDFLVNLDRFLNKKAENDFYLRKEQLLNYINGQKLSDAKRNKMKLFLQASLNGVSMRAKPIRPTKAMSDEISCTLSYFVYPGTYQKVNISGESSCPINLFVFSKIIEGGFQDYDIIRIKYSSVGPVVIEGRAKGKDEIFYAISQIS